MLALVYALMVLRKAFDGEYVVQDDVRQHVFWMQRFVDPQLFPNDLIADYFQSVSPWGFTQFYRLFAAIGVHPLLLSKLLPVGLSMIAATYAFGVGTQLLPMPFTGFLASLLTTQVLWTHDDVVSATPRAFLPPLFLAFLYYLLRWDGKLMPKVALPCLAIIVLEGLFYPQYVLVFAGVVLLGLLSWRQGRLRLSQDKQDYWFVGICLAMSFLVLLPIALSTSAYGSVVPIAEARQLPEFSEIGRNQFFLSDPADFWLWADRSGLFPAFRPRFLAIGFLLPVLLFFSNRYPARFPLSQRLSRNAEVLWRIAAVAIALFAGAHLLLFKLYLPSRYTAYTLRFVLVFATAIVLTLLLDALWHWLRQQPHPRLQHRLPVWGVTLLLLGALLLYPSYAKSQAEDSYSIGDETKLYKFFAQQPKDVLIASLARQVDNFPTFSARSILIGREYALPYQVDYARQFRKRAIDTINAQYSLDAATLSAFIQAYKVDFWILDRRTSFRPAPLQKTWIRQYPEAFQTALAHMEQGTPILKTLTQPCLIARDQDLQVLSTKCILKRLNAEGQG